MKKYILFTLLALGIAYTHAQVVPVSLSQDSLTKDWTLLRGGQPYFVKGASGFNRYRELAGHGANSVRLYSTDASTQANLDTAQTYGLTVLMCLWVPHGNGLDYNDTAAVNRQFNNFQNWVMTYRNHPAVLGWAIGNEAVTGNADPRMFDFVNRVSEMIHQVDGNHPTMTITASISVNLANLLVSRCPDLDLLGVNIYGGINASPNAIANSNWEKAWMITEWGTNGPWESPRTGWGAAVEATSSKKREQFRTRYEQVILAHPGQCLGSYAFLWGQKPEGSQTWFSLTFYGLETEPVDALHYKWSNDTWPANRSPEIISGHFNGKTPNQSVIITQADSNLVEVVSQDPDGDSLQYEFLVRPWQGNEGVTNIPGATMPAMPIEVHQLGNGKAYIKLGPEHNFKTLTLYCFVKDGKGHLSYINIPFKVEFAPTGSNVPGIYNAVQDAYIRDGFYADKDLGKNHSLVLQSKISNQVGYNRQTLVQFDLKGLSQPLRNVQLRLYGQGPDSVAVSAYGFSQLFWDENTVSWEDDIQAQTPKLSTAFMQDDSLQWYNWEVSSFVQSKLSAGDSLLSFILSCDSSFVGDPVSWQSREAAVNPPHLYFTFATSVDPVQTAQEIRIWPNPTEDLVNIETPPSWQGQPYRVQLIQSNGQLLQDKIQQSERFSLDLTGYPQGIYFIRLQHQNGTSWSKKLLKR